jgi:hypothetical protein
MVSLWHAEALSRQEGVSHPYPLPEGCQLPTIFALECLGVCYGREIPVSVLRSPLNTGTAYEQSVR